MVGRFFQYQYQAQEQKQGEQMRVNPCVCDVAGKSALQTMQRRGQSYQSCDATLMFRDHLLYVC